MKTCPQCHRTLPGDSPAGLCPACVLGIARPAGGAGEAQTRPYGGEPRDAAVPVDEVAVHFPHLQNWELIGQGGMGTVYKAYQPNLDRFVAVKVLAPRFAADPSFAERFSREARTLARLTHQNIINVFDFGQHGSLYFLVMEFVDGVNLREAMRTASLSPQQALAIVPQVCEALQYAHDEGIIHRDIKPENILLDRKGRVKIADFGLAKLIDGMAEPQWTLTGTRQVLGTLNYMAPEQIERPAAVDHRADIYSLGVVLYELLTGELPLGRFPLPSEKGAAPIGLDQVVLKTLEKEPARRYQQASEVRTAVQSAWTGSLGVPATAPAWTEQPQGGTARPLRVSFKVAEPHMNLTVTHGVLRIVDGKLEMDYAVKENIFQSFRLKHGQHSIPLGDVLSIQCRKRWKSTRLEFTLDRPLNLDGIPNKDAGKFEVLVPVSDHVECWRLVNAVRGANRQPLVTLESTGHVEGKAPLTGRALAGHRLRWPAGGLIASGAINLAAVPLLILGALLFPSDIVPQPPRPVIHADGSLVAGADGPQSQVMVELETDAARQPADAFGVADRMRNAARESTEGRFLIGPIMILIAVLGIGLAWGALGVALIVTGLRLLSVTHLKWCHTMSIIACIPLHPGCIIGIPAGIWSLITLHKIRTK